MLMALLGALLLGGAAAAQATPSLNYECNQVVGVNVVSCNEVNVGDVKVEVEGNRVLTGNEITILENNLNNADVDVNVIKGVVIDTYKSFNPSIDIDTGDITVCVLAHCK
ncbi:MAG: hypothetical protein ACRDTE_26140 [Pseudonocardiaceae bacterium]